jgi:zinc transport system ATP-binding protein
VKSPAVEVEGLSVVLGAHVALDQLDLRIEQGDFVVVAGPNGAGKSTLLRALLGLLQPDQGSVRVLGHSPGQLRPEWVGYVPQIKKLDRSFPALSCELVASGLIHRWPWRVGREAHDRAVETLREVGGMHLEHRPVKALSGGELQRVYLARALVRKPRLVLLDEPATGIDIAGESDMYQILDEYHRQREATILMVTHDWMAARHHASHVLLLNRRVIHYGPPTEALSAAHLVQAFGHGSHVHAMGVDIGTLTGVADD